MSGVGDAIRVGDRFQHRLGAVVLATERATAKKWKYVCEKDGAPWAAGDMGLSSFLSPEWIRLPRLDANAADVAREVKERRDVQRGNVLFAVSPHCRRHFACGGGSCQFPDVSAQEWKDDKHVAAQMAAINATYQESEAQRRERDAILQRMRPGVGVMNLAPMGPGWDMRGKGRR